MTALITLLAAIPATNVSPTASPQYGYASHYAPAVFETVVAHRFANDWWRSPPPPDWYTVAGYAATTDCAQVGQVVLMRPAGDIRWHRVLVADCAGNWDTLNWMLDNRIIAELDHSLFTRWATRYGVPLAIELQEPTS